MGGFPHYLIQEIHDQPAAVRNTAQAHAEAGEVCFRHVRLGKTELQGVSKINIAASGSSRHAGMAGRTMLHELARIPVEVDYASEFERRNVPGLGELTIVITQSGETADTLSALRKGKAEGSRTLAITNVPNSTIAREADAVIHTHAGPEVSIAATKSFAAQLTALFLFALYLGKTREALASETAREYLAELLALPEKIQRTLGQDSACRELARVCQGAHTMIFVGRGIHYPIAMDGALKVTETSYLPATGYPTGELKHGPYALIEEGLPVVLLAARDRRNPASDAQGKQTLLEMREIREHGARVIAVAVEGDSEAAEAAEAADHALWIPPAPELLLPILEIVPLQLLAYHLAVAKGRDVDRPRNLVKAVTS
jgi:glucosamine--fructose-6-phosphate aminotransferase (isomerizing)